MSRFISSALVFAGACLLCGALVATTDWAICRTHGGGDGCQRSKTEALQAFAAAANVALGVAFQNRTPSPKP